MLALVAILLVGQAAPPLAPRPVELVNLQDVLERAQGHPRVRAAQARRQVAALRLQEVGRLALPRLHATVLGGPSPDLRCVPSADNCISTDPSQLQPTFHGIYGRVDLRLDIPLTTFGKIRAGRAAGQAGIDAGDALARQAAADQAVEAARAYFAVKVGRALGAMLADGQKRLDQETARQRRHLDAGDGEITEGDHLRLLTAGSEVAQRAAEARLAAEAGLAGLRYAVDDDAVEPDGAPLAPLRFALPERPAVALAARLHPTVRAAGAAARAAASLRQVEARRLLPDLLAVGTATYAHATGVEHPDNAFLNDPFNQRTAGVGLVLQWVPDWAARLSRIAQADGAAAAARADQAAAEAGLPAAALAAWSRADEARSRLQAARQGGRYARTWLATALQAEAAGLGEARELAEAIVQSFVLRGRALQATFDWNVAVMDLQRAMGALPTALPTEQEVAP